MYKMTEKIDNDFGILMNTDDNNSKNIAIVSSKSPPTALPIPVLIHHFYK